MVSTRIELVIEQDCGLTANAIEAQFRDQYGDALANIDIAQQ